MSQDRNKRVCPVEIAGGLDNKLRKFLQNPRKILAPYLKPGMTTLDVGCGPGVFSVEMAKMVGASGSVIAADLQEGMLQILKNKIKGTALEPTIRLHKCEAERIGVSENFDFILAFYMVHEVPNKTTFFEEVKSLLRDNGRVLIVEPNFHVSKKEFHKMLESLVSMGFHIIETPKIFLSRSVLLEKAA